MMRMKRRKVRIIGISLFLMALTFCEIHQIYYEAVNLMVTNVSNHPPQKILRSQL